MDDELNLEPLERAPLADPWAEERSRRPGAALIRVINLSRDLQAFGDMRAMAPRRDPELFDELRKTFGTFGSGMTFILRDDPGAPALTHEQELEIIAEYNDVWRAQHDLER